MNKILYIGNFLSKTHGTIGPAVSLIEHFSRSGHIVNSASSKRNKVLRIFEMCQKALSCSYNIIIIDVYSTSALSFAEICSFIAKLRNKKIILTLQGGGLPDVYKIKSSRVDTLLQRATVITSPSMYLQQFFKYYGFNVVYIPNTIDLDKFPFVKERPHNHSILWVRAFTKIYNPDIAVRVLSLVKKDYPDATMTMVGPDKGNKKEVESLISNLNLQGSIQLTGKIPNEKLFKYYDTHDVYLNTTSFESFGVAVLESASCGTPIVSTAVGEIPLMWKDNENILLSNSISDRELAEKICSLFADRDLYNTIQDKARQKAREFSWEHVENLWNNVLL